MFHVSLVLLVMCWTLLSTLSHYPGYENEKTNIKITLCSVDYF